MNIYIIRRLHSDEVKKKILDFDKKTKQKRLYDTFFLSIRLCKHIGANYFSLASKTAEDLKKTNSLCVGSLTAVIGDSLLKSAAPK